MDHWPLIIITAAVGVSTLCATVHAWRVTCRTGRRCVNLRASRLMLRFCKHPTPRNWSDAWEFIHRHEVLLHDLDWPLVKRFARTAVSIQFGPT